jgi:delta 1-pyrroline-5-carboxylate dehydrogenase
MLQMKVNSPGRNLRARDFTGPCGFGAFGGRGGAGAGPRGFGGFECLSEVLEDFKVVVVLDVKAAKGLDKKNTKPRRKRKFKQKWRSRKQEFKPSWRSRRSSRQNSKKKWPNNPRNISSRT